MASSVDGRSGPCFHEREWKVVLDPSVVASKMKDAKIAAEIHQASQEGGVPLFRNIARWACKPEPSSQEIGIAAHRGKRKEMEDLYLVKKSEAFIGTETKPYELFAIFDGHGGIAAATFLQENLDRYISAEFGLMRDLSDCSIWNALKLAFVKCDEALKRVPDMKGGSTALVVICIDDNFWIANTGNSRAVLKSGAGDVVQLTQDGSLSIETFQKSVLKRGGKLYDVAGDGHLQINGRVAVARSFGYPDIVSAQEPSTYCVSPRPKIVRLFGSQLRRGDCILLFTDGVSQVASTEDVGEVAKEWGVAATPEWIAKTLVTQALAAGSRDNILVVVIPLRQGVPQLKKT